MLARLQKGVLLFILEVIGIPHPQKQTRKSGKQWYDPSKEHKLQIQWQVKPHAPRQPLECSISMDLTFYLPIPKSESKSKQRQMANQIIMHSKRPDVDNLAYIVTNALKEIFYKDDSQIVDLSLHKRYGEVPKTVIKIIAIEELANTRGKELH
jgi:Holliday junction resolvase RusA-like endonuclease